MRIYNMINALHEHTFSDWVHDKGNKGLAKRLYTRYFEISRIGKPREYNERSDISLSMVLKSYLARKVYINEKHLRGGFHNPEIYHKENEFTSGLWDIYCTLQFGSIQPELPVPCTYKEVHEILIAKEKYKQFSMYSVANDVITYNTINGGDITSMTKFDAKVGLSFNLTKNNKCRSTYDGRADFDEHLIAFAIGLYKLDYYKHPEPYKNFWKEKALSAIYKVYVVNESTVITKFRNADMYGINRIKNWPSIKKYEWNRTK